MGDRPDSLRWGCRPEVPTVRPPGPAPRWQAVLARQVDWIVADERTRVEPAAAEVLRSEALTEQAIREALPSKYREMELIIDLPQHIDRPDPRAATAGQNYLFRSATNEIRALTDDELYKHLPVNQLVCRIYLPKRAPEEHHHAVAKALDSLLGSSREDDLTNM